MGGSENEAAIAIVTTKNGGYSSGETLSNNGDVSSNNGNQDMWVVKLRQIQDT